MSLASAIAWPDASAAVEPALRRLAGASLQSALFIAAVWALCRLAPRLSPRLRCWLWWTAGLKFLLGLLWVPAVALPLLPPAVAAHGPAWAMPVLTEAGPGGATLEAPGSAATEAGMGTQNGPGNAAAGILPGRTSRVHRQAASAGRGLPPWQAALAAGWLAGLLIQAGRAGRGLARARRLAGQAPAVEEPNALALLASLATGMGVRRRVELRSSDRIGAPQTLGLRRPVILLPLSHLSEGELAMALCHELAHVRRHDLAWCWVPVLAEGVFFFHPLASLAVREYGLAREAACDAEVLRLLAPVPRDYGRLLLKLTVSQHRPGLLPAPLRAPGALGTLSPSPTARNLKRRLQMLQDSPLASRRSWPRIALTTALVLAGVAPFRLVARAADPVPADRPATASPRLSGPATSPAAPAAANPVASLAALPTATASATSGDNRGSQPHTEASTSSSYSYSYSYSDDGDAYALVVGEDHFSMNISGGGRGHRGNHTSELGDFEAFKSRHKGDFLWFRHDGKSYWTQNPGTLKKAQELLAPARELGKQQGELGARQGELGARQGELGGQQGELGARMGELGAEQASLAADAPGRRGQDTADFDKRHEAIGQKMKELGEKMHTLGKQQSELGKQQSELGRQQRDLGRQQQQASREAARGMHDLIEKALASGLAQESHP